MAEIRAGAIFLSYRREDTEHVTGRLADRIQMRSDQISVFMDVDSIPPGTDFVKAITSAINGCDVVLVMIGPHWLTAIDDRGRRRLDDPDDFVVLELREALARDIPVIPVLVDAAVMPKSVDLPPVLEPLTRREAVHLEAETFRQDSDWLLDQIAQLLPGAERIERLETQPRLYAGEMGESLGAQHHVQLRGETSQGHHRLSRRAFLGVAAAAGVLGTTGTAWLISRQGTTGDIQPGWVASTGGEVYSSPAVVDGRLYVGSNDHHLYAIDAKSGRQLWRYATGESVTSSPTVVDGIAYVGSNDTKVHAVSAASGQVRWTFPTGAAMHSSPAVDAGVLYIGCRDHHVYAIDAVSGTERWRFAGGDWFNSSPTVADDTIYIGCRDKNVYALDARTGAKRWSYTTNSSVDSSPAVSGGTVWIGSDDHRVYALDAHNGAWIWDFEAEGGVVSTPYFSGDVLFVGSDDGNLYALDANTGRERWRYGTGNSIRSSPTVADGIVYVGSRDFALYAVDAVTGKQRWKFETRGPIDDSSPVVADHMVYVGSLDHSVYGFSA